MWVGERGRKEEYRASTYFSIYLTPRQKNLFSRLFSLVCFVVQQQFSSRENCWTSFSEVHSMAFLCREGEGRRDKFKDFVAMAIDLVAQQRQEKKDNKLTDILMVRVGENFFPAGMVILLL